MSSSNLELALQAYSNSLEKIESVYPDISEMEVTKLLVARDKLHFILKDSFDIGIDVQQKIFKLDQKLCKYSEAIAQVKNLPEWRKSFHISETAWWWHFSKSTDSRDRFDWLWSSLTIACLTANLSLLLDLSSRFLVGGPDLFGSFTIISQSVLTLVAAGGALSQFGREAIEKLLEYKGISKHRWNEVKFFSSLGLLIILVTIHVNLPLFAKLYNHWGTQYQKKDEWSSAKDNFERALKLNPDDAESHFRLGLLYENLPDVKQAQLHYQLAVQGNIPEAFNNLARLYILDKNYSEAIILLNGLETRLIGQNANSLEYGFRKNLGWARLEQNRYNEAATQLQEAIRIDSAQGAAHCLLAQVYEKQNDNNAAHMWEACLENTHSDLPEEDRWIQKARDYFRENTATN